MSAIFLTEGITTPRYSTGEVISDGDWVRVHVPRLGVWHHGIVRRVYRVWNGFAVEVAHNMKESGVAVSNLYDFSDGNRVLLQAPASSQAHIALILARVNANVDKPYHLFAQNCEHFASFCFTGKAESKSLQGIAAMAALAFGIAIVVGR